MSSIANDQASLTAGFSTRELTPNPTVLCTDLWSKATGKCDAVSEHLGIQFETTPPQLSVPQRDRTAPASVHRRDPSGTRHPLPNSRCGIWPSAECHGHLTAAGDSFEICTWRSRVSATNGFQMVTEGVPPRRAVFDSNRTKSAVETFSPHGEHCTGREGCRPRADASFGLKTWRELADFQVDGRSPDGRPGQGKRGTLIGNQGHPCATKATRGHCLMRDAGRQR
jgi:hypothetical protein